MTITIHCPDKGNGSIVVTDNGPGIAPETVAAILDFDTRTSSREAYISPTRGAQGNALKTLIAMPYVLDNAAEVTAVIEARGIQHTIGLSVDAVQQKPIITRKSRPCGRLARCGSLPSTRSAMSLKRSGNQRV